MPSCPVPFVAWPHPGLPGWAGALDLVVVLAPDGSDTGSASAVAEAVLQARPLYLGLDPFEVSRIAKRFAIYRVTSEQIEPASCLLRKRVDCSDKHVVAYLIEMPAIAQPCPRRRDVIGSAFA